MSNLEIIGILVQIKVEDRFLKEFYIFLAIILNEPSKNLVRNVNLFKFTTQDKRLQIFEISLFYTRFGKHLEQLSKQMVDCSDFNAEFCSHSESFGLHHLALLEFFDAGVNVFSEEILHAFFQLVFSGFFLVRKACESNHFAIKDINSSPQNLKPIISIISSNEIKVFFPMQ